MWHREGEETRKGALMEEEEEEEEKERPPRSHGRPV